MENQQIATAIAALGLTVESKFVPFSQSRHKDEKRPCLNWIVRIECKGREVLTTEYMAGMGHCPAYKSKVPAAWDRPARMWQPLACAEECENGHALGLFTSWGRFRHDKAKPILPDAFDVIYSLIVDSRVLDSGGFEEWAMEYDYDPDSRKAESLYRTCLETALKLRAAIGDSGMGMLRDLFEDY